MGELGKGEGDFFVSRTQLIEARKEIERLLEKQKGRRLRAREQEKLDGLQGLTRRELLKKGGLALGLGVAGGLTAYGFLRSSGEPENDPAGQVVAQPAVIEEKNMNEATVENKEEKVELVVGVKSIIAEYNAWLDSQELSELNNGEAVEQFVKIFNRKIKAIKTAVQIPELSLKEFNRTGDSKILFQEFSVIVDLLKKQGYYFRAIPTLGTWKNEQLDFMAVLLGEIKSQETRHVSRRGKNADYEHMVIKAIGPNDSESNYRSSPARYTAITYVDLNGKTVVVQDEIGYMASANTIDRELNRPVETEKDMAVYAAFGKFKNLDHASYLTAIKESLMETSLEHEEQHVIDGHLEEDSLDQKNLPKHMIIEMRGLFGPLGGKNPKIALENLFNWNISTDGIRKIIGQISLGIIRDLSGKEPIELFSASDEDIRRIGDLAMQASDVFYKLVLEEGKPFDESTQAEYEKFLQDFRKK